MGLCFFSLLLKGSFHRVRLFGFLIPMHRSSGNVPLGFEAGPSLYSPKTNMFTFGALVHLDFRWVSTHIYNPFRAFIAEYSLAFIALNEIAEKERFLFPADVTIFGHCIHMPVVESMLPSMIWSNVASSLFSVHIPRRFRGSFSFFPSMLANSISFPSTMVRPA